jgi:hypothetical protein
MTSLRWEPFSRTTGKRGEFADVPGLGRFVVERPKYSRQYLAKFANRTRQRSFRVGTIEEAKAQCEQWLAERIGDDLA